MSLPSTIHLGFAKCGSTFLQAYWRHHPQVHLVFKACYYSPLDGCSYAAGPAHYSRLLEGAAEGAKIVSSDEHLLMGLFHPRLNVRSITLECVDVICRRIHETSPDSKLLLVVRNQVAMMVSTYSQYLLGGGTLTLDEFAAEFMNCTLDGQNYFSFYFDEIVEMLSSFFPGRLKVVLAEELAGDSEHQLASICEFMGIHYLHYQSTFKDRRIGLSRIGMPFVRGLNRLLVRRNGSRFEPDLWVPKPVYKAICNTARVVEHYALRKWAGPNRFQLASKDLVERMQDHFSDSNVRLGSLLKKDLSQWNYYACEPTRGATRAAASTNPMKTATS